jgi:hypothetical protein
MLNMLELIKKLRVFVCTMLLGESTFRVQHYRY